MHDRVILVQLRPRRVVASMDKVHYDNYLYLVALNKQQINWKKSKNQQRQNLEIGNSCKASADFTQNITTPSLSGRMIKMEQNKKKMFKL